VQAGKHVTLHVHRCSKSQAADSKLAVGRSVLTNVGCATGGPWVGT
jgi:hypothetical protein